jgi:hypothetical protein
MAIAEAGRRRRRRRPPVKLAMIGGAVCRAATKQNQGLEWLKILPPRPKT